MFLLVQPLQKLAKNMKNKIVTVLFYVKVAFSF